MKNYENYNNQNSKKKNQKNLIDNYFIKISFINFF